MAIGKLQAKWLVPSLKVLVYRMVDSRETPVAYVMRQGALGWKVMPFAAGKKPSRTHSEDPATAIQKYFGKLIVIDYDDEKPVKFEKSEVLHGVFEIRNAKQRGDDCRTISYTAYVRLVGVSRGAAIKVIKADLAKRCYVTLDDVIFHFWCEGNTSAGPIPTIITKDSL